MSLGPAAITKSCGERNGAVCLWPILLCVLLVLLFSCAFLKSEDDEEPVAQGSTLSLEELEYSEGLNAPTPEEPPPSLEAGPSEAPSQVAEKRGVEPSSLAPVRPDRRLKKRVFVLPFRNETDHGDRSYGEITTQKLIQILDGSGGVVILDAQLLERFASERGSPMAALSKPDWIQELHSAFGAQAVIAGALTQLQVASTKSSVSQDIEVGLAVAKIEARFIDARTGNTIQTYMARNPLYKSKEIGEFNQERAILRALDIGIQEVADRLLDSLEVLDWSAHVVRTDSSRIYIDAGQRSGLQAGDILDVYGPGEEIINPVTRLSLGWAPGERKGRVRITGFFGIDAAYATPIEGDGFRPQDLVKVSLSQDEGLR